MEESSTSNVQRCDDSSEEPDYGLNDKLWIKGCEK